MPAAGILTFVPRLHNVSEACIDLQARPSDTRHGAGNIREAPWQSGRPAILRAVLQMHLLSSQACAHSQGGPPSNVALPGMPGDNCHDEMQVCLYGRLYSHYSSSWQLSCVCLKSMALRCIQLVASWRAMQGV